MEVKIERLKCIEANTTSEDGKENECVESEISWWEEKLTKKKQKKEQEEALIRELQELRASQAKNKQEYNEMLAKARVDFQEEIKANFIQEMSSSQTAALSTPCVGPLNVAVSTIPSSQESALHLPGSDAPRDR